jgi:hypothetical protein
MFQQASARATEFEECFVNVSPALKANAKLTKIVEPIREHARPSGGIFPVRCHVLAVPRDYRFDAALAESLTMRLGFVATVRVDHFLLLKRAPARAANGSDRVNEWQQLGNIAAIRAGQVRRNRDRGGIDEDVVLGTWSRAI